MEITFCLFNRSLIHNSYSYLLYYLGFSVVVVVVVVVGWWGFLRAT